MARANAQGPDTLLQTDRDYSQKSTCSSGDRSDRATAPDGEEAMLIVKNNANQILRSSFASTRNLCAGSTSLVLSVSVVVCMMVWSPPLVAADAADPCMIPRRQTCFDREGDRFLQTGHGGRQRSQDYPLRRQSTRERTVAVPCRAG